VRRSRLWLALPAAAAAVGAGLWLVRRKASGQPNREEKDSAAASPIMTNPQTGTYSFISGFQDAAAIELSFPYDADRFRYAVCEDEFLVESGDSHVGILSGDDFSMQVEYASYYRGEDFPALTCALKEKHPSLCPVRYGNLDGVSYQDGDNWCLAFPIPEDSFSYLLITLVKAAGNDDEVAALPEYPDIKAMLGTMQFTRF